MNILKEGFHLFVPGSVARVVFLLLLLLLCFMLMVFVLKSNWRKQIDFFIKKVVTAFRKDNVSILVFVLAPIVATILIYEMEVCPSFNNRIGSEAFYSIFFTIFSVFLTMMVSLQLVGRRVSMGEDFLRHLVKQMSKLKGNENIYIITPNINLGFGLKLGDTKNKQLYQRFKKMAMEKHEHVFFISYDLNLCYLKLFNSTMSIEKYSNLAVKKDSLMIHYLYQRYFKGTGGKVKKAEVSSFNEMVADLMQMKDNIKIINKYKVLKESIHDDNICGYLTKRECLIGVYNDIDKKDGQVYFEKAAGGEKINDSLSIKIAKICIESIIKEKIEL